MKKLKLILLLVLTSITTSYAQINEEKSNSNKNSVFFEALGKGGFGSLNYQRKLLKNTDLSFSIGIGIIDEGNLTLPIALHYAIPVSKSKKGFLEIGTGFTFSQKKENSFENDSNHFATFSTGYKRNFGDNWFWKANLTQLLTKRYSNQDFDIFDLKTFPSIGISIGKSF